MPAPTRVEIKGLRELGEKLHELGDKVATRLARRSMNRAARLIRLQMATLAPVARGPLSKGALSQPAGALRSSIRSSARFRRSEGAVVAKVGPRGRPFLRVASWLEGGTKHMAPRPFLAPAFEATKHPAVELLERELRQAVEDAAR